MLNNKKIWATLLIAFSYRRNIRILFYDVISKKKMHLLRPFSFLALVWISFPMTFLVATNTYPANFMIYKAIMRSAATTFMAAGDIFGYDILLFVAAF